MGKMIELEVDQLNFPVYVSKPAGKPKGGLIVIHEVWGLSQHIKNIADRFSEKGYYVLAPNFLSEVGLSEKLIGSLQEELFDPARRSAAQPKIRSLMAPMQAPDFAGNTITKLRKCFDFLYDNEDLNKNVAVTGYCFGGSYSFSLAVNEPRLKAAIPFYGHADFSVEELKKIKCPVLAFYGENDERLITGLPELVENMKKASVDFKYTVYPSCGHAFFNDTNPYAYNKMAAEDAFNKTLELLARKLA